MAIFRKNFEVIFLKIYEVSEAYGPTDVVGCVQAVRLINDRTILTKA